MEALGNGKTRVYLLPEDPRSGTAADIWLPRLANRPSSIAGSSAQLEVRGFLMQRYSGGQGGVAVNGRGAETAERYPYRATASALRQRTVRDRPEPQRPDHGGKLPGPLLSGLDRRHLRQSRQRLTRCRTPGSTTIPAPASATMRPNRVSSGTTSSPITTACTLPALQTFTKAAGTSFSKATTSRTSLPSTAARKTWFFATT